MPIRSAASFLTPPALSSARRIVSCSIHSMFVRSFSDRERVRRAGRHAQHRDRRRRNDAVGRQHHRALDRVFELADVTRPFVGRELLMHALIDALDVLAGALLMLAHEVIGKHGDVFAPVPEGRHFDWDDVEAIEQIFLKRAVQHHLAQIAVGGGDDAHVHLLAALRSQRLEFALLQHPQKLGLQHRAHRADLVEENRAPVGQRELSRAPSPRSSATGPAARSARRSTASRSSPRCSAPRPRSGSARSRSTRASTSCGARARRTPSR